ncbi:MAG TPA: hypothetical protein GX525_08525 [Bacilli bacterium]|nr:hypothetical protein [Bacilli bacterium]
MKRLSLYMLMIFGLFALIGCSQQQGTLEPVDEDTAAEAEAFVHEYKEVMIRESNEGSFHDIEEYLVTNSTFYHTLRRYMQDLTQNFKSLSLVSHEVSRVQKNEINEYYVDAVEKVEVTDRKGNTTLEETPITYILVEYHGKFRIMTILKR